MLKQCGTLNDLSALAISRRSMEPLCAASIAWKAAKGSHPDPRGAGKWGRRDGACPNIGPPDARHCRASACERVEELSVVDEPIVVRVHLLHHLFDVLWNERQVPHAERAHDLIHIDEAAVVVVHVPDEEWESEHHRNVSSDVSSLLSQSTHRKVTGRGSLYALEAAIEHLLHRRQSEAIRAHQRTERQLACS